MEGSAAASVTQLQQTGRIEGQARNIGATIDEIEDVAARLSTLFRRLDDQTGALKEQSHARLEPDFSAPWIKESHLAWRKGDAAARDLTARPR